MDNDLEANQHLICGSGIIGNIYNNENIKVLVSTIKIEHSYTIKKGECFARLLLTRLSTVNNEYNTFLR